MLRQLGIAARFVSGYLIQLDARPASVERPPGAREGLHRSARLVRVLRARRRLDRARPDLGAVRRRGAHSARVHTAALVRGADRGSDGRGRDRILVFDARSAVSSIGLASPSRTPTSSGSGIVELGDRVDADLRASDVRLSVGGEPTFVSSRTRTRPEWNTAALGGEKADARRSAAPAVVRALGQGRLSAFTARASGTRASSCPRWALGCFFRHDGGVLWRDPRWIGQTGTRLRPRRPSTRSASRGA